MQKTHWIEATIVGSWRQFVCVRHVHPWLIEAKGRQARRIVNVDGLGFPRERAKGPSCMQGIKTGSLVRAVVTKRKKIAMYQGRVVIKFDIYFKLILCPFGMVEGFSALWSPHLPQGWVYLCARSGGVSSTSVKQQCLRTAFS